MIVVALSFHSGDAHLADDLLRWIGKISDVSDYDCILVVDDATPFDKVIAIKARAEGVFKSATLVSTGGTVSGWPLGPNLNWRTAMAWGRINKQPILFLETDAIPLKPNWLTALQVEYDLCGKQHLGQIEATWQLDLPARCLSGVAIYGPRTTWPLIETPRAFNVDYADLLVPDAAHTPLIRDFFGQKDRAPFFVGPGADPRQPGNALTMQWLPESAVIFHRDKTHSLIPILAARLGIPWEPTKRPKPITVVFPVHRGDFQLAMAHSALLRRFGKWNHRAVIAYDPTLGLGSANQLRSSLLPCFPDVSLFQYANPPIRQYPAVANWAFQCVAHHMHDLGAPWLWFEADAVALRSDWLTVLQNEYERGRKPFMGPHVPGMRHPNGTMIYPANGSSLMTRAMTCPPHEAFDMMNEEIMPLCHDCSSLIFHVWTVIGNQFIPVNGGGVPANITPELAANIPRSAVMIHRVKDRSLIDLLLSGRYVHH